MAKVRNPLASLFLTILAALGMSIAVSFPIQFFGYFGLAFIELELFYLFFAAFGAGVVAGRASFLASMGAVGSLLGGIVGFYLFQLFLRPTGWPIGLDMLLTLGLAAICALGGAASGKLGIRRVERAIEDLPKLRRCQRCGSRVGLGARRCWSCKAYLPPT